ncbi:acyl carrier protein [Planctomycetota bacterium]
MQIRNEIRAYIIDNILFGDDSQLSDNASFQETGVLDSAGFLEVITFLEEKYGIAISDSDIVPDNFDTVQRMAVYVETMKSDKALTC